MGGLQEGDLIVRLTADVNGCWLPTRLLAAGGAGIAAQTSIQATRLARI
jgi:hypothetical protein